jgi:peptidoglycan/xylan/chitin deacetylase (PgdA/CDA1 family)
MIPMRLPLRGMLGAVTVLTLGATAVSHHASRAASAPVPDSLRVPILVYHSVMPHHPGQTAEQRVLDVSDSVFVAQMRYLVDGGYHVVSFAALVDALEGRDTLPPRAVVLTFDDGWENQYHHAFPILRRFGFTATFFVFTAPIGKDGKVMTWEQLRALQAAGMTIGSHTRTHPILPDYHAALHNEVAMSRADIAEHLGRAPDFFAYPFGAWDAQSAAWARKAGYRAARTYRGGAWNAPSDLYHLRAIPVTDNMQAFERAVSGDSTGVVAQRGR